MKKLSTLYLGILFSTIGFAQSWVPLGNGTNDYVRTLLADTVNNIVYAGGNFTTAGTNITNYIASWDGTSWSGLGNGTDGIIYDLEFYNGQLHVCGLFGLADGVPVNYIAKWNGTTWEALGSGLPWVAFSMEVYNGDLYVAGIFDSAGGIAAKSIARWNGSVWDSVGTGLTGSAMAEGYCLKVYNGELYVGGWFDKAGGVPARGIAKWNGTTWSVVGGDMTGGYLKAFEVYNGELYAGGGFMTIAGDTIPHIARWNGSSWNSLGVGMVYDGYNNMVFALEELNGELYIGGRFPMAGGSPMNRIAKWDGSNWSTVGTGMDNTVYSLAALNNELYAGGMLSLAGGTPVNNIAKWGSPIGLNDNISSEDELTIYPNPTTGQFTIQGATDEIQIFDLFGRLVLRTNKEQIDMSSYPAGLYVWQIGSERGKLILE